MALSTATRLDKGGGMGLTRVAPLFPLLVLPLGCSLAGTGEQLLAARLRSGGFAPVDMQKGDISLHYWRGGNGAPLVLLHGFGGDGVGSWQAQLGDLRHDHRLYVPDLLWFGQSHGGGPPSLDSQVAAVVALLDQEGLARADVMGISYGGFVALQLAATAPTRIDHLIIVDSPGPYFSAEDEAAMVARFGKPSAEALFLPDDPAGVQTLLDLTLHRPRHYPTFLLRDLQKNVFSAHRDEQRSLLADLHARRETWSAPDLSGHPAPLVVWGRYDEVFPVTIGQKLADTLGATLTVIPDTAHGPCIEAPDAFNAAIHSYLDNAAKPR